jgi:uncharacterized protein
MSNYHEPVEELSKEARDFSRILTSLKEEIEAIDWYHQRIDCSDNESLKAILAHNRDEEISHASMALEWLRCNMPGWDERLRKYLFTDGGNANQEYEEDENGGGTSKDLNIGKL